MKKFGGHSMVAPLCRVIVKRPSEAFGSHEQIESQWNALGYSAPPDLGAACREHEALVGVLERENVEVLTLPADAVPGSTPSTRTIRG